MSMRSHLTAASLLALMLVLSAVAGCQRPSAPEQKQEPAATGKLVTVSVPGMS
jgi:hypothetical protein